MRAPTSAFAKVVVLSAGLVSAAPGARFTAPFQPYVSADKHVHLLRPARAQVSSSDQPVGSLMSGGWRLTWDGAPPTPGHVVVRLSLPVATQAPQTRATEYLQVGVSRNRAVLRSCLAFGLAGGSPYLLPDRLINGRRFTVRRAGDAGMSQQIDATDLRAVVDGACYAIERFSYGDSASRLDPSVALAQSRGAAMLDQALASLQLGRIPPDQVKRPVTVSLPRGAVAY